MKFILTGGQAEDITQAHALLEGMNPGMVIADKGYDANHFVEAVEAKSAQPVIPPRSN